MSTIRVIDQNGNNIDLECGVAPRIGERLMLPYGIGKEPISNRISE
jgi:hypothetical protein